MKEITKKPAEILHKILRKTEPGEDILDVIKNMRLVMLKANGVGLAANQIGLDLAIFVIDKKLAEENKVPDAYINPEIVQKSKETSVMEEGCLSIPDFWLDIKRAKKIHLKALDANGNKIKLKAKGFLARVLQHEIDHLNGVLIDQYQN